MSYSVHAGPADLPNALVVENVAGLPILPGAIVENSAASFALGDAETVGQLLIAKERGPGEGGEIDTAFALGDGMSAYNARQGLFFRVRAGTGQALVKNVTLLERAASGRLAVLSTGTAVAIAKETVTTTADDQLVLVEAL